MNRTVYTRRHGGGRLAALTLLCVISIAAPGQAHESPVAHVDRTMTMWAKDGRLYLRYRVQVPELMAMMQLHEADTNRDGKVSDAEWDVFRDGMVKRMKGLLRVEFEGKTSELEIVGKLTADAQLGQTYLFSAPLPTAGDAKDAKKSARLRDEFSRIYPGACRYLNSVAIPEGAKRIEAELETQVEKADGAHPAIVVLKFTVDGK